MRGGEGTEEERASLPGCAVGCVARVRGLISIDTAVEVLLMTDDVLRRGQYESERHDLHALERLRLRSRVGGDDATAMRATIVRAGGVVAARAHVMAILVLTDWSLARSSVVVYRHCWRVDEASCAGTAGWQRRRMDWSRYRWWCAVVIEHTSLSLAGWTPALIRERSFETRDALFAGRPSG